MDVEGDNVTCKVQARHQNFQSLLTERFTAAAVESLRKLKILWRLVARKTNICGALLRMVLHPEMTFV